MREREDFCPNCTCNHCKDGREREAFWRAEEAAARRRFWGGAYGASHVRMAFTDDEDARFARALDRINAFRPETQPKETP